MRQKKLKPAGVRVDGSKRIDLKEKRTRRKQNRQVASAKLLQAAPVEDTRVADVWRRDELRSSLRIKAEGQARRMTRLSKADGGKEGIRVTAVKVRISAQRSETQAIRSRPGTFEWRYGRKRQDALFHAGSHLAVLWERAGIAVASSADFLRGIGSGYASGISDGRVAAIDKLDGFVKEMGRVPAERMIDYCVSGLTTAEIAMKHGAKEREMAPVLHFDLRNCAVHFKFISGNRR
ncbi:hypothetical protein [Mesorhizobium japonicum]|uniref:Mll0467 protein n=1 Tax=Mesorhizobium japonicum (strain LMG 29417 / CECT 9101 / MAFF 303099) TaxID=266835 RepID=Q98MR7_RHILO|nr:hypothetical protein [Mesorhizobium japonicum]BAB48046.1 mll0467 [Mesorhizobium japonicum MAFF 303099]